MKCPVCQAKLLPVDGQMFCLQCGEAVTLKPGEDSQGPALEETADPLLQRAIVDVLPGGVKFRLPVRAPTVPKKVASFASAQTFLSLPRVVSTAGGTAAVAGPVLNLLTEKKNPVRAGGWWRRLPLAWVVGTSVFALFLLLNLGIYLQYSNRVYPGVHVGQVDIGNIPLSSLHQKLASVLSETRLVARVGTAQYSLDTTSLSSDDLGRVERTVRSLGHTTPLPVAGIIQAWMSPPIAMDQQLKDAAVNRLAAQLAAQVTHRPSDAVPMVVNGQAFVIAQKTGSQLSVAKAAAAIRAAYGRTATFSVTPDKLEPIIAASAYENDVQQAQTMLGLSLQVKRKGVVYVPAPAQIGDWLIFRGPGRGIAVDSAGVASFVASIPGSFDRTAATNAVLGALQSDQSVTYNVSTKAITATPKLASALPSLPFASYSYCVGGDTAQDMQALGQQAAATLADGNGWTLGGRLKFELANEACNLTLRVTSEEGMKTLAASCVGKSSCQVGNEVLVRDSDWAAAPAVWKGTLVAYRAELINHEIGHWLGFDHASCVGRAVPAPILAVPTVVLGGCSPNWYEVPVDLQGTKALNPF
jgi:hypothetical protein